jgi:deoxyribonuclease-4
MLVHANDSVSVLGSHLDRHQHIGMGYLGRQTFELLIKNKHFGVLPFIIETPKVNIEADRRNIKILKIIGIRYGRI